MTLEAKNVRVGYDGHPVLEGVSLRITPGRTVGLTGPSGVGKTSLARAMAGLVRPVAGEVTLDGNPVHTRRGRMDGRVAMLFQSPRRSCSPRQRLGELIGEPLRHPSPGRPRTDRAGQAERVLALATEVGLTHDLLERLPDEVSDGQLQRAALARALAPEPDYLLCDEATAMLDAITTASIVTVLRRRASDGLGVLAISHDQELLSVWADTVVDLGQLRDREPRPGQLA